MLVWLGPDATELAEHAHAIGPEVFRAVEGELTVVVDGEPRQLTPEQTLTVEPGERHYFRNDTDDFVAFHVELPWTKTIDAQMTSFGMDHDGYFGAYGRYGEPGIDQGILFSEYLKDGTRITAVPHFAQRMLWTIVGPLARLTGRSAVDDRYLQDEFWERTVEQPPL